MKKILLPFMILLMFAFAACGGEVEPNAIAESAANITEGVVESVNNELSEPAANPAPTEEVVPVEEVSVDETAVEEASNEAETATDGRVIVDVTSAPAATIENTDVYYHLQSMFLEEQNKCLEGQGGAAPGSGAVLDGSAFMNDCQNVTGQIWKIVPSDQDGYYRLQNMIGEENDLCLEGNQYPDGEVLGGAAFMDSCQGVVGQYWKFVESNAPGYYRLQTQFLESENKCLESNQYPNGGVLSGASFMDDCQDVIGQFWKLVPEGTSTEGSGDTSEREIVDVAGVPAATIENTDVYYHLQSMFLEEQNKCLEGQGGAAPGSGAVLDGSAFMNDCQNVTGQIWKIVPSDQDGYYHLQNMIGEESGLCLEGNQYPDGEVLGGAAFMDSCQGVVGQYWKFVESETLGYYHLQTQFLEGENKCLESNQYPDGGVLSGASFMDDCQNVTGQFWKIVPQN